MKVLFVFNHPAPYKVELLKRIAPWIDLMVLFERQKNRDRDPRFYQNESLSFPHRFLKGIAFGKENFLSSEIRKEIKKNHYDLIVMNGYSTLAEILAIRYMIRKKIPYALYVNGGFIHTDSAWKYRFKTKLISHAFRYYAPSEKIDSYLLHYGARKEDIRYYPYATISEKEIATSPLSKEEKENILQSYHLPTKTPIFISVGQFIPRKNMMLLLEIFRLHPNLHLLLVGGGKEETKYRQYMEQYHMNNVTILPFLPRKQLFPLMRACHSLILLSKEDIYGHVINEALSQGIGVIASDKIIAAQTLIQNGIQGYIVSNQNHDMIHQAIELSLQKSFFDEAIAVAKQNTYEQSAACHIALWKKEA